MEAGKSFAILEKQDELGGYVATYTDPSTNKTMDYGVVVFKNTTTSYNYLTNQLGASMGEFKGFYEGGKTKYLDYTNGNEVSGPVPGANVTEAEQIYLKQMQTYGNLFAGPGFDMPDPIPEDLLLPFGEWVKKYHAEAMAYNVYYLHAGIVLDMTTLNVMKYHSQNEYTTGSLYIQNRGNQALYNLAYSKLGGGENVFLESNIQSLTRSENGVEAIVQRPCGTQTFRAKKVIIAIRPRNSDLKQFLDLRPNEERIFSEFSHIHSYTCILNGTGLPIDTGYQLVDLTRTGGIPMVPEAIGISQSGFRDREARAFWWTTPDEISAEKATSNLLRTAYFVQGLQGAQSPEGERPTINGLVHNSPYFMHPSREAIARGFYKDLYGLQGQLNTFWTGAAWESESSPTIWAFNEKIMIPQILQSLA